MPRNLSVMVANLFDHCAVSKPQILCCAGAILLCPDIAAPNVLAAFGIRGSEHTSAPTAPGTPFKTSVFILIHPWFMKTPD
jgi:hypothetical protein